MSSYDKVVKLACKPKAAAPKSKYLDPILAATWSEDGAVHDVCKALSPRFREPNAIVVFKALIVLHTMIRNGATDNVLSYLSSGEVLRLKNVSTGNWEGYNAPQNLQSYAIYLDSRIRAYRDLKHDAVRVQAESNRDMRNTNSIEEDMASRGERGTAKGPQRSKTVMGRKLRVMTVEKGLLRETKAVQRMIDSLVECRFYLDDLEDELTTTALRMLVKDLLILFQAGNEGVINVLEHYFEMSHVDASTALSIYRQFCKQTERVVEYLGVAKKLQNLLNVPIPNLKHAPVSLVGALEEYLKDPNFEQNRIEYRASRQAADRTTDAVGSNSSSSAGGTKTAPKVSFAETDKPEKAPPSSNSALASTSSSASKPEANQAMQDFFAAIEEEQPNMFNPRTGSPTASYFQQQAMHNPFNLLGAQPTGIQPQPTGFMIPQQTAFQQPQQPNPFNSQPTPQQQHLPFSSFLQQQNPGFLQPQPTGSNPFRQSMMLPQSTGFFPSPFVVGGTQNQPGPSQGGQFPLSSPFGLSGSSSFGSSVSASPFSQNPAVKTAADLPARPASTPLTSFGSSPQLKLASPPEAQPVRTHQTGSRNPFGIPVATPPPVPKAPTLMELAMAGSNTNANPQGGQNGVSGRQPEQLQQTQPFNGMNAFNGGGDMANVASSFSFQNGNKAGLPDLSGTFPALNSQNTATTTSGSTASDSFFSSSSGQPTSTTTASGTPSVSLSPTLKPQMTGFGGLKPFKPTSSFGASLLESLPPIPGSSSNLTSVTNGNPPAGTSTPSSAPGGLPSFSAGSGFNSPSTGLGSMIPQPTGAPFGTGSSLGVGLRPQMTGVANPFRASMLAGPSSGPMNGAFPSSTSSPSGFGGRSFSAGLSPWSGGPFGAFGGGALGSGLSANGTNQDPSTQSKQNVS